METSKCIYNFRGKCEHKDAPIPSSSDCRGENDCDVVLKSKEVK